MDWAALGNPIFSRPGWAVKDPTMARRDGVYFILFSAFYADHGPACTGGIRSHVVGVATEDFRSYTPLLEWRGTEGGESGWNGLCSPNLARRGESYFLTYNGWEGSASGERNKLFYATSPDLVHWSGHHRLAANLLRKETRAIDAAVAFVEDRVYLLYKEGQTPRVAVGTEMGPDGWRSLGTPNLGWFENGQLIRVDGRWRLVGTKRRLGVHYTFIAEMLGEGTQEEDWLRWGRPRRLAIPREAFNRAQAANAGFLADWRERDGFFYLVYSGRTEGRSFAGRGDEKLGLARSRDLLTWEVPGG